jgi:hypothetical protein
VAIGATIMQAQLRTHLPAMFAAEFVPGQDITESAIPTIPHLPYPLQGEVREAFSDSLRVVWFFLLGCACVGWLSVFLMRELPLHTQRDRKWGLEERKETGGDKEKEGEEKEKAAAAAKDGSVEQKSEEGNEAGNPAVVVSTLTRDGGEQGPTRIV